LRAQALYNRACALYRAGDAQGALAVLRESLLQRPDDPDAKANFEWLLRKLESPPEQDQQNQDQQNQDQQNQDQQNQDQQNQDQQNQDQQNQDQQNQDQQNQDQQNQDQQEEQQRPPEDGAGENEEVRPQGMRPEDVERLLESLGLQEKTIQAERLKARLKTSSAGKDW
jgi:Ca-activated chloride channel family protein